MARGRIPGGKMVHLAGEGGSIMRTTLRLGLLLAVGVLIGGPARGDEDIDAAKRQIKIATDKLIADVRDGLREADQEARKSLQEAMKVLEYVETLFVGVKN